LNLTQQNAIGRYGQSVQLEYPVRKAKLNCYEMQQNTCDYKIKKNFCMKQVILSIRQISLYTKLIGITTK